MAVRHFDHLNIIAGFDELPAKVAAVRRLCEDIGRDPVTLETSQLITVIVDEKATIDQIPEDRRQRAAVGSPEAIAEQIKTKVFDAGVGGIIFNMPSYTPGAVTALSEALKPLLPQ